MQTGPTLGSMLFLFRILLITLLGGLIIASAQMTPNAPVKDFRLPRFAENGYAQWVLQGGRGIYDSPEQVRVEAMVLRVYSADERMAQELSLESPEATLRIQENTAQSEAAIRILGANFEISGIGWKWDGNRKEIEVLSDASVRFSQGLNGTFSSHDVRSKNAVETVIRSQRLVLKTTETDYLFEFTGAVGVDSGVMQLTSESLYVEADAPKGKLEKVAGENLGQLDAVRKVIAQRKVMIVESGRTVRSDLAEFYPREDRAFLSGNAHVELETAYLSGSTIESKQNRIILVGDARHGRAQMILYKTGGLGLKGQGALSEETIVLADRIELQSATTQNTFLFTGSVDVMSGPIQLQSDRMTIVSATESKSEATTEESELAFGSVESLLAEGAVQVLNGDQKATGASVEFFPSEGRAVLSGDPRITSGEAVVDGQWMELKPESALIRGSATSPVIVSLPAMPDMGFDPTMGMGAESSEPIEPSENTTKPSSENSSLEPTVEAKEPAKTVIQSDNLMMTQVEGGSHFEFKEAVNVLANNLVADCERMDVYTREVKTEGTSAKHQLERIEAYDSVRIEQMGRVATAGKATILPIEGRVVLEEKAVVEDARGRVSGHKLILLQGERRAIVEGGGADGERARITLPGMGGKEE